LLCLALILSQDEPGASNKFKKKKWQQDLALKGNKVFLHLIKEVAQERMFVLLIISCTVYLFATTDSFLTVLRAFKRYKIKTFISILIKKSISSCLKGIIVTYSKINTVYFIS
jgi:hypothetical protein